MVQGVLTRVNIYEGAKWFGTLPRLDRVYQIFSLRQLVSEQYSLRSNFKR